MRVDQSETPDTYDSVQVVDVVDNNSPSGEHYKVHKSVTYEGTIYYHSVHEPAMHDISSYEDIETLASWMVSTASSEEEIMLRANIHAVRQHLSSKPDSENPADKVLHQECTNETT